MRQVLAMLALAVAAVGCDGSSAAEDELLVSAASSLSEAFSEIENAFESEHPGLDVVLNLGGSAQLRDQVIEGAPADVIASADAEILDDLAGAGLIRGDYQLLALNRLRIAVPRGNPGGLEGIEDLADPSLLIGLCAKGVPCGDFAREILQRAGVEPEVDTEEPNVRALMVKIEAGEIDAGIVYDSDVTSSSGVEGIEIPERINVSARYAIAVLEGGSNQEGASEFVAFTLSDRGTEILNAHGFAAP